MKYAIEIDSTWHDIRTMFHDDRCKHLSNITVNTAAV
jgi:hypothetical protein